MRIDKGNTRWYSVKNISGLYALAIVIVIFSISAPSTFLTIETAKTVLNQSAISGLIALALVMPLSAGLFDVSVGYTLGLTGVVAGWLLMNTSFPVWAVIALSLLVGASIGLVNAFVIIVLGVESIIATLGSGSLLFAASIALSGDTPLVTRVAGTFSRTTATASLHGLTVPVFLYLGATMVVAFITEHMAAGRYMYALGFDADVARLSGLRTSLLRVGALVGGAALAGVAGLALTGYVGAASPEVGPAYLLPAFAGAFLGATQIRAGRFNAWGTLVAVIFLGTGDEGILLVGGPPWTPQVFQGTALILAVAIAGIGGSKGATRLRIRRPKRVPQPPSEAATDAAESDVRARRIEAGRAFSSLGPSGAKVTARFGRGESNPPACASIQSESRSDESSR